MSRDVKKTRQLCILMVMSLIFSGIYLVNIQVEAAVCSKASDYLISGYFSCVTISQHEQLVSEELAGLRNISEFLNQQRMREGCSVELGESFIIPVFQPGLFSYYADQSRELTEVSTDRQNAVVRFIHRKDGEKDRYL